MSVKRIVILVAMALAFFTVVGAAGGGLPNFGGGEPTQPQSQQPAAQATPANGTPQATPQATETPKPKTPTPARPAGVATKQQAIILLNPATVMAGAAVNVNGAGFAPNAAVDFYVKIDEKDKGDSVGFVQADKGGNFSGFTFTLPVEYAGQRFIVEARQHDGKRQARAQGNAAANSPVVKFGTQVGKPGDMVTFSAKGFVPDENVNVYFNSLGGEPVVQLHTNKAGGLDQEAIKVPFGAVGDNSFIFVGEKSRSPVTVPFMLLNFYPSVTVSDYAPKADTVITFSGDGFGPRERVSVHLNDPASPPITVFETEDDGTFAEQGAFLVPFDIEGENTIIVLGEQSQASATVAFNVQPYTPFAEASTYGARPGTTVTFYGSGFARDEVVRVFVGATHDSPGKEVACMKADGNGDVRGQGNYTVPFDAQPGTLGFKLVGDKSHGAATAEFEVMAAGGPVPNRAENQPEKGYVCEFDAAQPERPEPEGGSDSQQPEVQTDSSAQPGQGGTATPEAQGNRSQPAASPTRTPTAAKPQPTATAAKPQPTATPTRTPTARPSPTRSGG